ncbi:hypothetical protein KJ785_03870 [Patescibacteria group bacterium]|nr:hypothetical protein [Patescibacteria group bacterium]
MKLLKYKKLFIIIILAGVLFSVQAMALTAKEAGEQAAKETSSVKLGNPLGEGRVDIRVILGDIVATGMGFLGSVTLLVFVYGGFLWLTSAGNAERVKKGTQTMLWATVGLFLIFGSYGIMTLVLEGVGAKNQKDFKGLNLTEIKVQEIKTPEKQVAQGQEGCYCKTIGADGKLSSEKVAVIAFTTPAECPTSESKQGYSDCEWNVSQ